jgi:hypothetical protein
MGNEQFNLAELNERASALGYARIQRQVDIAPTLPLATWNGFSTESGSGFSHVAVWFRLDGNKVAVNKMGKPEAYYRLS